MYKEEIGLIESIFGDSDENQIWSIYSLCNHSKLFQDIEECRNILFEIRNYEKFELVYLKLSVNHSNELVNKLRYESELVRDGIEIKKSEIYGISRRHGDSVGRFDGNKNVNQFYTECEDVYRNIGTISLLSDKLWSSRFSQIFSESSTTRINKNGADLGGSNDDHAILRDERIADECRTEPCKSIKDIRGSTDCENNTDPRPIKSSHGSALEDKIKQEKREETTNLGLFDNEDDFDTHKDNELNPDEDVKMTGVKSLGRKRSNMDKNTVANENYDYSQVRPIKYNKIKKERIYKDEKTGYLVVEDNVDFVMEEEKSSKSQISKTNTTAVPTNHSVSSKRSRKVGVNGDSKQQTLNSFFKIVGKNKTDN